MAVEVAPILNEALTDQAELIKWAKSRPDVISKIKYCHKQAGSYPAYLSEAALNSEIAPNVVGLGRATNPVWAVAISVSEAIERLQMIHASQSSDSFSSYFVNFSSKSLDLQDGCLDPPPPCFMSSNGWAAHFNSRSAIKGAVMEALERSLHLINFGLYGWQNGYQSSLNCNTELAENSFVTKCSLGGFKSGFVALPCHGFKGRSLGYWIAPSASIHSTERIGQAYYEALAAVEYLRTAPTLPSTFDCVSRHQKWLVENEWPFERASEDSCEHILADSIQCGVRLYNVQEKLGLPFPFFVAYAYGGDLIPLYFDSSTDVQGLRYIQTRLAKYGVKEVRFDHPVL